MSLEQVDRALLLVKQAMEHRRSGRSQSAGAISSLTEQRFGSEWHSHSHRDSTRRTIIETFLVLCLTGAHLLGQFVRTIIETTTFLITLEYV
jgi:hypothetical protein